MNIDFERSYRSLSADAFRGSGIVLLLGVGLLATWLAWFFVGQVSVYAPSTTARLEVDQSVYPVDAPVEGRVVSFQLALGSTVNPGDVLLELDTRTQRLELGEQTARLAVAKGLLEQLNDVLMAEQRVLDADRAVAGLAVAEAMARRKQAEALAKVAKAKADRWRALRDSGLVSPIDDIEAEGAATESREAANAQGMSASRRGEEGRKDQAVQRVVIERLRHESDTLRGSIKVGEATIARLQYEIDRRIVKAPIGGRLGQVSTLRIGSVVSSGQRLATVVPEGRIRAVGRFLPSTSVGRIQKNQHARIRFDGFPWTQYGLLGATVSEVAQEPLEGSLRVELDVNPASNPRIPLTHGLPGRVEVEVERVSLATLTLRAAGNLIATQDAPQHEAAGN